MLLYNIRLTTKESNYLTDIIEFTKIVFAKQ